jgi:tRNA 5-methylaminomethyl-2-thiouridine biosynthesis bifunctional protein
MNEPVRWRAAPAAELDWEDGEVPRSTHFEDVYYSRASGLEETRHVFLQANGLPQRWREHDDRRFVIMETGFGTGLNFLSTWKLWREQGKPAVLHYISIEKFPLRAAQLQRALAPWTSLADLSSQLQGSYPPPLPGMHRLEFEGGRVILDLLFEDAIPALEQLGEDEKLQVNAWFLDGFAPSRNPQMWRNELYEHMSMLSAPAATFATFTAAGQVRRGLDEAGFKVEKCPGFGHKREMCKGVFCGPAPQRALRCTPWHIAPSQNVTRESSHRQAIVLGAGLAGCSVAHSLARRGWRVSVLERGELAGAASGNQQGVLYTRISHRHSQLSQFSLHSYGYALRKYRELMDDGLLLEGRDGAFCGALHLQDPAADHPLRETVRSLPELARFIDAQQASRVSGLEHCPAGLYFPEAGWLHPPAVCRALLAHRNIKLIEHCGELELLAGGPGWTARDARQETRGEGTIAVVACGTASSCINGLDWLPLQAIRGQVTHLPSPPALQNLQTVICHDGYIAPAHRDSHCLGASFSIDDHNARLRRADHAGNLAKLEKSLSLDLDQNPARVAELGGRVAWRCASPDYLPLAGPVPDYAAFAQDYAALRKNARRVLSNRGSFRVGLYLSTGHGSRGLTSSPLTAELIASQICGEAAPMETSLVRALAPARFIVRDLVRNKVQACPG